MGWKASGWVLRDQNSGLLWEGLAYEAPVAPFQEQVQVAPGHGQVGHVGLVQRVHVGVHHTLVALVGLHAWESLGVWVVLASLGVWEALVDPCGGVVLEAS